MSQQYHIEGSCRALARPIHGIGRADADIPSHIATFLNDYGLPELESDYFMTLFGEPEEFRSVTFNGEQYLLIGEDYATAISIKSDDTLWSIPLENEDLPVRFINTDLEKFVSFLCAYLHKLPQSRELTEDEVAILVPQLREEFQSIDPSFSEADEGYWSLILEQLENLMF